MNININPLIERTTPQFEIIRTGRVFPIEEAKKILSSYSSISKFEDSKWIADKINLDQNLSNKQRTLYFGKFDNPILLNEVKLWAVNLLIRKLSTGNIATKIAYLRKLLSFCNVTEPFNFDDVTPMEISYFHSFLFSKSTNSLKCNLETWYNTATFFKEMEHWEQFYIMERFIVPAYPKNKKNKDKFIPNEVAKELDVCFKTLDMPEPYRTIYWLLRLIPNRVTEVLSMQINCLKRIDDKTFILTIPTFKQYSTYIITKLKLLEIKDEGVGSYLIELIQNQIKFTKANLDKEDNTNFLFRSHVYRCYENKGGSFGYKKFRGVKNVSADSFNSFIKRLCKIQNITMPNNGELNITSHQFRHNAISDRMNSGIFRAIDIMSLTAHTNTKMIEQTYTHPSKNDLIKETPIVFRGRIINTSDKKLDQLLAKPYAKRVYKLGICSDIRTCHKDKSKCLRCDYLIPNIDDLEYCKYELEDWKSKKSAADKVGNLIFSDLCSYWIESYEILIKKVIHAITSEDLDIKDFN